MFGLTFCGEESRTDSGSPAVMRKQKKTSRRQGEELKHPRSRTADPWRLMESEPDQEPPGSRTMEDGARHMDSAEPNELFEVCSFTKSSSCSS